MKIKNRFVLVLIIAGSLVIAVLAGIVLVRWTNAISSKQRVQELRTALKSVLDTYGEIRLHGHTAMTSFRTSAYSRPATGPLCT